MVSLKQGDSMSTILFSLFVEDLELFLQNKIDSGLTLDDIILILLMFADDMVIYGTSLEDLQNSLNQLKIYYDTWGLSVNTDKTQIVVFRKKGVDYGRLKYGIITETLFL